jgi:hypothetical protein
VRGQDDVAELSRFPDILLFFAYTRIVPTARTCAVSFTDSEGITHSVEISASSLYEAAVLALAEFRRSGIAAVTPGPGTRLRVEVKAPEVTHELSVGKLTGGQREDAGGEGAQDAAERHSLLNVYRTCRSFSARADPVKGF